MFTFLVALVQGKRARLLSVFHAPLGLSEMDSPARAGPARRLASEDATTGERATEEDHNVCLDRPASPGNPEVASDQYHPASPVTGRREMATVSMKGNGEPRQPRSGGNDDISRVVSTTISPVGHIEDIDTECADAVLHFLDVCAESKFNRKDEKLRSFDVESAPLANSKDCNENYPPSPITFVTPPPELSDPQPIRSGYTSNPASGIDDEIVCWKCGTVGFTDQTELSHHEKSCFKAADRTMTVSDKASGANAVVSPMPVSQTKDKQRVNIPLGNFIPVPSPVLAARAENKKAKAKAKKAKSNDGTVKKGSGLGPKGNTYYWTKKNKKSFNEAIGQHGRDWEKVAEHVGTKTANQCEMYFQKVNSPDKSDDFQKKPTKTKKTKRAVSSKESGDKEDRPSKRSKLYADANKGHSPPKPASEPYVFFAVEMQPIVKSMFPNATPTGINRMVGMRWQTLRSEKKKTFERMSSKDKRRFNQEMVAYEQKQEEQAEKETYAVYAAVARSEALSAFPNITPAGLGHMISMRWRNLSKQQKAKFQQIGQVQK